MHLGKDIAIFMLELKENIGHCHSRSKYYKEKPGLKMLLEHNKWGDNTVNLWLTATGVITSEVSVIHACD